MFFNIHAAFHNKLHFNLHLPIIDPQAILSNHPYTKEILVKSIARPPARISIPITPSCTRVDPQRTEHHRINHLSRYPSPLIINHTQLTAHHAYTIVAAVYSPPPSTAITHRRTFTLTRVQNFVTRATVTGDLDSVKTGTLASPVRVYI